jgi:nicotinamide-nucleotide amidase
MPWQHSCCRVDERNTIVADFINQQEEIAMDAALFSADLLEQAAHVLEACRRRSIRIAAAESCTGGMLTALLTEIPGASDVVDRCFVCYSNEAKVDMLGIAPDMIDTFGAVSPAVAWAMARGAIAQTQADIAIAITGIAGPAGARPNKPVGHVVFGVAHKGCDPDDIIAQTREFGDIGRTQIRLAAVRVALGLLAPSC